MLDVILFDFLKRFHKSYHPDNAFVKMSLFCFYLFTTTVRNKFSRKIDLVKTENHQIEFLTMWI